MADFIPLENCTDSMLSMEICRSTKPRLQTGFQSIIRFHRKRSRLHLYHSADDFLQSLVYHHAKKLRMEFEERQKQTEGVMKKLREKDKEIQRMVKLNLALQERVKILSDMAQKNEAAANLLRSKLERVSCAAALEEDAESCCGSSDHGDAGVAHSSGDGYAGQQSSSCHPYGHSYFTRGIGTQPLIRNPIPLAQHHNVWGTHQPGNYEQHQAQARHGQRPTMPSLIGQGFPTATPQASNILGRREHENSPPVVSSKRIAMPSRGLNLNIRSPPPSPRPSSHPSPPVMLQGDSSQPLKPSSGQICMFCKRDVTFTPPPDVTVFPCGHVFHDECLKKILHDKKIPYATGET